jgi:2,3-bisphosphoglycerate-dependent phosphoglycerate mutase
MHLESISPADIVALEVPTGIPFVYELTGELGVMSSRYLGDPSAAAAAADAVARQAG